LTLSGVQTFIYTEFMGAIYALEHAWKWGFSKALVEKWFFFSL